MMVTEPAAGRHSLRRPSAASETQARSGRAAARYSPMRAPQVTSSASAPAGAGALIPSSQAATGAARSAAGAKRTSTTQTAIERAKTTAAGWAMGDSFVERLK